MNCHVVTVKTHRPAPDGVFVFWLVLTTGNADNRFAFDDLNFPVPAEILLDYAGLQRFILLRCGLLWRHALVEGRSPDHAAESWRAILGEFLAPPDVQTLAHAPPGAFH